MLDYESRFFIVWQFISIFLEVSTLSIIGLSYHSVTYDTIFLIFVSDTIFESKVSYKSLQESTLAVDYGNIYILS